MYEDGYVWRALTEDPGPTRSTFFPSLPVGHPYRDGWPGCHHGPSCSGHGWRWTQPYHPFPPLGVAPPPHHPRAVSMGGRGGHQGPVGAGHQGPVGAGHQGPVGAGHQGPVGADWPVFGFVSTPPGAVAWGAVPGVEPTPGAVAGGPWPGAPTTHGAVAGWPVAPGAVAARARAPHPEPGPGGTVVLGYRHTSTPDSLAGGSHGEGVGGGYRGGRWAQGEGVGRGTGGGGGHL